MPSKRQIGRPRASGVPAGSEPAEDILRAAAELFAVRGFVGTSTRQIAAAAGLRQSALFHWFPRKQEILERRFSRGWDRSLEYFAAVAQTNCPAAVKLCLCLGYDAGRVAGAAAHIQLMIVPPELRHPRFKHLLQKRQRLIDYLETFIQLAISEGDFRRLHAPQAARMVLAIDEAILDAARSGSRSAPQSHSARVVDLALHALMIDRRRIPQILHYLSVGITNDEAK